MLIFFYKFCCSMRFHSRFLRVNIRGNPIEDPIIFERFHMGVDHLVRFLVLRLDGIEMLKCPCYSEAFWSGLSVVWALRWERAAENSAGLPERYGGEQKVVIKQEKSNLECWIRVQRASVLAFMKLISLHFRFRNSRHWCFLMRSTRQPSWNTRIARCSFTSHWATVHRRNQYF